MKQKSLGVKARKRIGSVVYHCFMVLLSLTMIYPFVWSVLSSFKTSEQLYGGSPLDLLPKPATLYNYERLFQVLPFGKFVINSFFLAVAMPICMIAVASLTAYALTRLEFKGRNILFLAFVATMMVPSHVTLIPNYKIVVDAHLPGKRYQRQLSDVGAAKHSGGKAAGKGAETQCLYLQPYAECSQNQR